eukprot:31494-Pelagococcus_subviridis.AAC.23
MATARLRLTNVGRRDRVWCSRSEIFVAADSAPARVFQIRASNGLSRADAQVCARTTAARRRHDGRAESGEGRRGAASAASGRGASPRNPRRVRGRLKALRPLSDAEPI